MSAELRAEVVRGCHVLAIAGHSDMTLGHVSARDPDGRGVWMKRYGLGFEEVTERDVLLVSWDGEVLEGEARRHREYPIHTELMRAHDDVSSVVHSHPPYASAFASTGRQLEPVSHPNAVFARGVPVYEDAIGLVETAAAGARLATAIDGHRALLLAGHGVVTAGRSVGTAVAAAVMLERACELQQLADGFGGVARWLREKDVTDEHVIAQSDEHLLECWAYLVRRLEATDGAA